MEAAEDGLQPTGGEGDPHLLQSCLGSVQGLSPRWTVGPRPWWRGTWRAWTACLAALQHARASADCPRCSAGLHGRIGSFRTGPCRSDGAQLHQGTSPCKPHGRGGRRRRKNVSSPHLCSGSWVDIADRARSVSCLLAPAQSKAWSSPSPAHEGVELSEVTLLSSSHRHRRP